MAAFRNKAVIHLCTFCVPVCSVYKILATPLSFTCFWFRDDRQMQSSRQIASHADLMQAALGNVRHPSRFDHRQRSQKTSGWEVNGRNLFRLLKRRRRTFFLPQQITCHLLYYTHTQAECLTNILDHQQISGLCHGWPEWTRQVLCVAAFLRFCLEWIRIKSHVKKHIFKVSFMIYWWETDKKSNNLKYSHLNI